MGLEVEAGGRRRPRYILLAAEVGKTLNNQPRLAIRVRKMLVLAGTALPCRALPAALAAAEG